MAGGGLAPTRVYAWSEPWLTFLEAALRTPSARATALDAVFTHFASTTEDDVGLGAVAFASVTGNPTSGPDAGSRLGWADRTVITAAWDDDDKRFDALGHATIPDVALDGVVTAEEAVSLRGSLLVETTPLGAALDRAADVIDGNGSGLTWAGDAASMASLLVPPISPPLDGPSIEAARLLDDLVRLGAWLLVDYDDTDTDQQEASRMAVANLAGNVYSYVGKGLGAGLGHLPITSASFTEQRASATMPSGTSLTTFALQLLGNLNFAGFSQQVLARVRLSRADHDALVKAFRYVVNTKTRTLPSFPGFPTAPPRVHELLDANDDTLLVPDANGHVDIGPLALHMTQLLIFALFGTNAQAQLAFRRAVDVLRSAVVIEALSEIVRFRESPSLPETGAVYSAETTQGHAPDGEVDVTLTVRFPVAGTSNVFPGAQVRARGNWTEAALALGRARTLLGIS